MPTRCWVRNPERIKDWNEGISEEQIKEQIENDKKLCGFTIAGTDLSTTEIVKRSGILHECWRCHKEMGSGMLIVGSGWGRLCPTCAKEYLEDFINSLENYKKQVEERLERVNQVDIAKWEEENRNKVIVSKLKEKK